MKIPLALPLNIGYSIILKATKGNAMLYSEPVEIVTETTGKQYVIKEHNSGLGAFVTVAPTFSEYYIYRLSDLVSFGWYDLTSEQVSHFEYLYKSGDASIVLEWLQDVAQGANYA